jgi:V/A-type H+-transporting ATPase subunit D
MTALSSELAGVHPTRLELVRLRRRRTLANGIIDILEKDLEALMTTLFELLKEIQLLRDRVEEALSEAYGLFIEAEMIIGSSKIEEVSLATQPVNFDLDMGEKSGVLGIPIPIFRLIEEKKDARVPRFSMLDTSARLDESSLRTWDVLSRIIKLAEAEASIRAILEVISVKRRQVNRLQYKVLPELDKTIRYVVLILEETERQDAIRVRVLQRKRKELALRST